MKRLISVIVMFAACLVLPMSVGQVAANNYYAWPAASTTGQVGSYITSTTAPSASYTISWTVPGSASLSACTFRIEGSPDGVNWYGLDATAPAVDSQPCTSTSAVSIAYKPNKFIRINIVSFTGTGAVTFQYTGK